MKIALDLDGVVTDFHWDILKFMGLQVYCDNIKGWKIWDWLPCTKKEFIDAWDKFTAEEKWVNMTLIDGALDGIQQILKWGHDIVFITSRKGDEKGQTYQWMLKKGLHYIPVRFSVDKHIILEQLQPALFFDDDSNHILRAREKNVRAVIFDRPWNKDIEGERITGKDHREQWQNLLKLVEETANEK